MRQTFLAATLAAAALTAVAYDAPENRYNYGNDFTGVAVVKGDGINLRMGPSASDPYLCSVSDDDMYFDPLSLQWSHTVGKYITPEKYQLYNGQRLGVTGKEGDWSKLYLNIVGNSFDVWTMTKFLNILPVTEVQPGMKESSEVSNNNCFKMFGPDTQNFCIYYQEPGMDEDGGFFFGHKQGKTAVFDHFLPIIATFDENESQFKIDQSDGMLYLKYGRAASVTPSEDYGFLNVELLPAELFAALSQYAQEIPAEDRPFAVGVSPTELVMFR